MNIAAIDLELNQLNGNPKIIQIGICIGNLDTKTIIEKRSFMVNPNEPITQFITELTGITDEEVKNAPDLKGAYIDMCEYLRVFGVHRQPIQWGSGDVYALKKELYETYGDKIDWKTFPFGWTDVNVKTVVQTILTSRGAKTQGGLAKSMNKFGLNFQGTKHRAEDDALNTMRLYFKLLDIFKEKGV